MGKQKNSKKIELNKISFQRYFVMVLSFVLILSSLLLPVRSVFAFSGTGSGTEGNPFQINTCAQLQEIASDMDAHYKLTANIDCSDTKNWNGGKGFDPIGFGTTYYYDFDLDEQVEVPGDPFTGHLDGAGHIINNLWINRANDIPSDEEPEEDETFVGLFGATEEATIQNVHIRNSRIKGWARVGGITGHMTGGTITNSSVNVTTADNSCDPGDCVWARYGHQGGGIVGFLDGGATLSFVRSGGPVKGSGYVIGGLVGGLYDGNLSDSSTSSNVDGGATIGGAIGNLDAGTVSRVWASGNVSATADESAGKSGRTIGGFVGSMGGDGIITGSYATGNVYYDDTQGGGFIGYMNGGIISNSYSSGSVTASEGSTRAGGFAGYVSNDSGEYIQNSFTVSLVDGGPNAKGGFTGYYQDINPDPEGLVNVFYDVYKSGKNACYARPTQSPENGEFNQPRGVAVNSAGDVYVVDSENHRVQKFNPAGDYVTKWGTEGSGNGEFSYPGAIEADSSGNVYVADAGNYRIQKFSSTGTYITQWGTFGGADGEFNSMDDIATDSSNNVYVLDGGNNRVQKFSSTGTYIAQWGTEGSGDGEFVYPTGIASDSSNNIYVVDSNNRRIQKFNSSGTYIAQWGTQGDGDGQFNYPTGIASDSADNIYVTDLENGNIQKFSSTGTFISKWGSFGEADNEFYTPRSIAVDSAGNSYIADTDNQSIKKFDSSSNFVSKWGNPGVGNVGCTSVNANNSQPGYFFNLANEPFAGSWDQDVWHFSGNSLPVLEPIDTDSDGIPSDIEDKAPNNGDGNNDGILDSEQSNVSSFISQETGKYVTLETDQACAVTFVAIVSQTSTGITDSGFGYPQGLMDFTLQCTDPGYTANVRQIYHNVDFTPLEVRKFNEQVKTYAKINDATTEHIKNENLDYIQARYQVMDGGELDQDGVINGTIEDPAGLAVSTDDVGTNSLANTGRDVIYTLITVTILLSLGVGAIVLQRFRQTKYRS